MMATCLSPPFFKLFMNCTHSYALHFKRRLTQTNKKNKSPLFVIQLWGRSSKFMSGTENDRQNWLPLHQVATLLSLSHSFSLCDWQHPGSALHLIKNHHIIPAVSQYLNINTGGSPPPPPHSIWQRQPANELHHYEKALTGDGGMWDRWRKGSVE